MAKYNSSGWHFQSKRHSNARRTGHAGGKYASIRTKDSATASKLFDKLKDKGVSDMFIYNATDNKYITFKNTKKNREIIEKTKGMKYMKDTDGDGVPDKYDCQPHNPKKQDTKAQKEGKEPIITWDEDIPQEEIDFRISEAKEHGETLSEDDARERIAESDYFELQWEDTIDYLGELMKQKTKGLSNDKYWKVEVKNFGWRNQDGEAVIETRDPAELLRKTLPKTDNHFKIFNNGKRGLKIQNYHHDSPTGNEWYTLRPMTAKEIKEHDGE